MRVSWWGERNAKYNPEYAVNRPCADRCTHRLQEEVWPGLSAGRAPSVRDCSGVSRQRALAYCDGGLPHARSRCSEDIQGESVWLPGDLLCRVSEGSHRQLYIHFLRDN